MLIYNYKIHTNINYNPSIPCDQHLISPYDINTLLTRQVIRIKDIDKQYTYRGNCKSSKVIGSLVVDYSSISHIRASSIS